MTQDPQQRELRPVSALLLLAIHMFGSIGIVAIGQAMSGSESISAVLIVGARFAAVLIALYVGLVRYAPHEATGPALRATKLPLHGWLVFALAVAFGLLAAPSLYAIVEALLSAASEEDTESFRRLFDGPGSEIIATVGVLVLIPAAEELLYRGLIQPRVMRFVGAARGILFSVLLFAAANQDPTAVLIGIGTAIAAHAAGNSWPAIVGAIVARCATAIVPYVLGGTPSWWLLALTAAAAAGVVVMTWRVRRPR